MDKNEFREFCDFVDTDPVLPSEKCSISVASLVQKKLNPEQWITAAKFVIVQMVTGMATLTICPQFEIGFTGHNAWLHQLHILTTPFVFFMICGFIFVTFGASLTCVLLSRDEIRSINRSRYLLFSGYTLLAYLIFVILGAEIVLIGAFAWISGAIIGNIIGFNLTERIKIL